MFEVKILTAYPSMFPGSLALSLTGTALSKKIWSLDIIDLHDFGIDRRKSIDDEPYGGGPGMVIKPEVVEKAVLGEVCPWSSPNAAAAAYWTIMRPDSSPGFSAKKGRIARRFGSSI